jgi:DNA-binding transcriptional regulator YdaS (Cro superfamily)
VATSLLDLDPRDAAAQVSSSHDEAWLAEFCDALQAGRRAGPLARVCDLWALTGADAARLFGVSRQAVSQWLERGVPAERLTAVADLAAATDVLAHHVRRERIPAVVRRVAANLGDRSLLDLAAAGDTRAVLAACRAMFDFGAITG